MVRKKKDSCCDSIAGGTCCCTVEAVISVDDRGQMVLPKDIREKANIQPGDKLAVVSWEKDHRVSCISLIKAEDFAEMVKDRLGPMMNDIVKEK